MVTYEKILKGDLEMPKFFNKKAKDLIIKLLNHDINERLGTSDCGKSIQKHAWFKGIDWEEIYNQ